MKRGMPRYTTVVPWYALILPWYTMVGSMVYHGKIQCTVYYHGTHYNTMVLQLMSWNTTSCTIW